MGNIVLKDFKTDLKIIPNNKLVDDYFSKNYLIKRTNFNGEIQNFSAEILVPMKEVYSSKDRKLWYSNNSNCCGTYCLVFKNYSKNASTQRVKENSLVNLLDDFESNHEDSKEYNERIRFSKSPIVVLRNYDEKIIGGAWLEPICKENYDNGKSHDIDQRMHIFLDEDMEGLDLGKALEFFVRTDCLDDRSTRLTCSWENGYKRAYNFFNRLGYEFKNNTTAKKRIKPKIINYKK